MHTLTHSHTDTMNMDATTTVTRATTTTTIADLLRGIAQRDRIIANTSQMLVILGRPIGQAPQAPLLNDPVAFAHQFSLVAPRVYLDGVSVPIPGTEDWSEIVRLAIEQHPTL